MARHSPSLELKELSIKLRRVDESQSKPVITLGNGTATAARGLVKRSKSKGSKDSQLLFQCTVCLKSFKYKKNFENHVEVHTPHPSFRCTETDCMGVYNSKESLKRHFHKVHSVKTFHCKICNKASKSKHAASEHRKIHSHQRPFSCKICPYKTITKARLDFHLETHEKKERNVQCPICPKKFKRYHVLLGHLKTHSSSKFKCQSCPLEFKTRQKLGDHTLRIHKKERKFFCNFCSRRFFTYRELEHHTHSHTGEMPYSCGSCSLHFSTAQLLKIHEAVHLDIRKYKCTQCNYRAKQAAGLTTHLRTHTKPYECPICKKTFSGRGRLKVHSYSHMREQGTLIGKPFPCPICPSQYNEEGDLRKHHKAIHVNVTEFGCKKCPSWFRRFAYLRNHERRVHGKIAD